MRRAHVLRLKEQATAAASSRLLAADTHTPLLDASWQEGLAPSASEQWDGTGGGGGGGAGGGGVVSVDRLGGMALQG